MQADLTEIAANKGIPLFWLVLPQLVKACEGFKDREDGAGESGEVIDVNSSG